MAYMGLVRVRRGERINASAVLQDDLQKLVADEIRPGVTAESGLSGLMSITWMVDESESSFRNTAADRAAFLTDALTDLDGSPWVQVIARAPPAGATTAGAPRANPSPPQPAPRPQTPPSTGATTPPSSTGATTPDRATAVADPPVETSSSISIPVPIPNTNTASSSAPPGTIPPPWPPPPPMPETAPEPQLIAGIPPDSPLAQIEIGMHHAKVRQILGEPDERIDRVSEKTKWIPFYSGPDARLIDWVYVGVGRVVFTMHTGKLLVYDAVAEPGK